MKHTRKDWILWGALACALVGTAHAEYTLGMATGGHWLVAGSVVGALDLYVVRALQVRRDVLVAVLVMVAANVASRLVHADVLPVGWPLYSAVGALAPFLLWRIQYLKRARPEHTPSTPEHTDTVSVSEPDTGDDEGWDRTYLPAGWTKESVLEPSTPAEHTVSVPGTPPCDCPSDDHFDGPCRDCTVLEPSTLPLPPGFEPSTPCSLCEGPCLSNHTSTTPPDTLEARDVPHWGTLIAYLDTCADTASTPGLRDFMRFGSFGQDRARRLMSAAGVPE